MNDILELKAIKESIMKVKSNLEYDINKEESLTLLNNTLTKLKDMTFDFSKDVRNKKIEDFSHFLFDKFTEMTNSSHTIEIFQEDYSDVIPKENMKQYIDEFVRDYKYNSDLTFDDFMSNKILELKAETVFDYESEVASQLIDMLNSPTTPQDIRNTYDMLVAENDGNKNLDMWDLFDFAGYNGPEIDWHDFIGIYDINIMFATENEKNLDMGSIYGMTTYIEDVPDDIAEHEFMEDNFKKECDNALTYLLHTQGYTLADFYKVLYKNEKADNFLDSVKDEFYNCTSFMRELTILTVLDRDNIEDFVDSINNPDKNLLFKAYSTVGLYNEWQGSGGPFEITLDKDFEIPTSMIRNIQFEHIHDKNINNGYTVDDVYSFASSSWCDNMETTDADNSKIISEDYSDAFKILCEAKEEYLEEQEQIKNRFDYEFGD